MKLGLAIRAMVAADVNRLKLFGIQESAQDAAVLVLVFDFIAHKTTQEHRRDFFALLMFLCGRKKVFDSFHILYHCIRIR
jgi:hypothetical protein